MANNNDIYTVLSGLLRKHRFALFLSFSLCLSLIRTVNTTQLWLKSRFVYYRWHIDTEVASNELQFCKRKEKKMALSWIMKKFLIDINYSCSRKQSTEEREKSSTNHTQNSFLMLRKCSTANFIRKYSSEGMKLARAHTQK